MVVHGVEQSTMGHAFWGVLMSGGVGSVVFSTVPLFHATVAAAICAGIQSEALITTADLCGVISANETADDCVHPSAASAMAISIGDRDATADRDGLEMAMFGSVPTLGVSSIAATAS